MNSWHKAWKVQAVQETRPFITARQQFSDDQMISRREQEKEKETEKEKEKEKEKERDGVSTRRQSCVSRGTCLAICIPGCAISCYFCMCFALLYFPIVVLTSDSSVRSSREVGKRQKALMLRSYARYSESDLSPI